MDDGVDSGEDTGDDENHTMYFGLRGEGISFVQIMADMRVFISEVYQGRLAQGSMLYGTKINEPTKLRIVKTTIT